MVRFNGPDEFFETMAEGGGKAYRFEDIDGIGPKTANKIKSVRGVSGPQDVADMSADELSDKAGISRSRATKAIRGGGGNPNVSKQDNTGTVSAAGFKQAQGDFMVEFTDMDKARAKNDARSRSEEAVRMDDKKRAPVTTDLDKWKNNKSHWDFPGVDTPREEPNLLPKDVKAGNPDTTDFEARDERIRERKEQSYPRKEKDGRVLQLEGNRIPAWEVNQEVPDIPGTAPGLAAQDFEEEPNTPSQTMGPEPSSQRLPEPIKQNLGTEAPENVLAQQGSAPGTDTLSNAMGGQSTQSENTSSGKPPFREPNIGLYNVGDEFNFTYESDRANAGLVSKSGTVVQKFDNRLQVDVGNSNYYEVFETGRVISISDNHNRTKVGYTVHS